MIVMIHYAFAKQNHYYYHYRKQKGALLCANSAKGWTAPALQLGVYSGAAFTAYFF